MGNIISYVRQHAEIPFESSPLCEADLLALALLSYAQLDGCVPSDGETDSVSIAEAHALYSKLPHDLDRYMRNGEKMLREMASTERFGNLRLSRYKSALDPAIPTQFAAVQIELGSDLVYLSYRGTDDSIAGWREDFMMAHDITVSQHMASDFMRAALRPGARYILSGHSKGGNHASFAALELPKEYRHQLSAILCFDSPGICPDLADEDDLAFVRSKTTRILPGFSIVGTLFNTDAPDVLIESTGKRVGQHDPYTWPISGKNLCRIQKMEAESELLTDMLAQWINSTTMQQRRVFVRDFFNAIEAGGASTLEEVERSGIIGFSAFARSFARSEAGTRKALRKLGEVLFRNLTIPRLFAATRGTVTIRKRKSATLVIPARKHPVIYGREHRLL